MPNAPFVVLVGRNRLAGQLRELRHRAELSTTGLAQRLKISQSKVSKVENAKTAISAAEVEKWATVCGASAHEVKGLVELAERALVEVVSNRSATRTGLSPVQAEWGALEAVSGTIKEYAPLTIPGLLETAAYAQLLYEIGKFPAAEVPSAVAARLERQSVLYNKAHQFHFIIAEVALRWRVAGPDVYLPQLDRIISLATLPNVHISILPMDQELPMRRWHGFVLFEDREDDGDPLGLIETMTSALTVSEPTELNQYGEVFDELQRAAARSQDAIGIMSAIRLELANRL